MKTRTGIHVSTLNAVMGAAMLAASAATLADEAGYWTYGGPFAMWANGRPNHDQYLRAEHEKAMAAMRQAKTEPRPWTYGGLFAAWAIGRQDHDEYLRRENEKVMQRLGAAKTTESSAELAAFEVTEESGGTAPMGFRPFDTHR